MPYLLLLLQELGSQRANNQDVPTSVSGGTLPDPIGLSPNKSVTAFPWDALSPAWPKDLWDQNQFAIQRVREVPKGGTRLLPELHGADVAYPLLTCCTTNPCFPGCPTMQTKGLDLGASFDMTY